MRTFTSAWIPIMSKFRLVIFDCDGVLVDSEPILNHAHSEILKEAAAQQQREL
jgi:beta-phosphoglucomutase-like phosphatase (HAD superfamily)